MHDVLLSRYMRDMANAGLQQQQRMFVEDAACERDAGGVAGWTRTCKMWQKRVRAVEIRLSCLAHMIVSVSSYADNAAQVPPSMPRLVSSPGQSHPVDEIYRLMQIRDLPDYSGACSRLWHFPLLYIVHAGPTSSYRGC